MARIELDFPFLSVHGKLGKKDNYYVATRKNGKMYVVNYNKTNKPPTVNQLEQQRRFAQIQAAIRMVRNDAILTDYFRRQYEQDKTHKFATFRGWLAHILSAK